MPTAPLLALAAAAFVAPLRPPPSSLSRRLSISLAGPEPEDDTDYYGLRFDGLGRLYGDGARERLAGARVCVVGIGSRATS